MIMFILLVVAASFTVVVTEAETALLAVLSKIYHTSLKACPEL